jgi:para-aminobenzoate synthetase/4-amino-4-deoxychorismate lyase
MQHQHMQQGPVLFKALFESFNSQRRGWSQAFRSPQSVYSAAVPDQVPDVVVKAQQAAARGQWAVVMLSYEAAPAFDPALAAHTGDGFPLALVAIYDDAESSPAISGISSATLLPETNAEPWAPQTSREEYARAIARIRDYISAGDAYQVNYTVPLVRCFSGDPEAWYRRLCSVQGAGYCAYLDLGRYVVISISPELFFERRGDRLITRPMKGTIARGRWEAEDLVRAGELAGSEKNRAENLMIVDLLRNDLGRIAAPGSVLVPELFSVERYETLWQMTSTIEATCRAGTQLMDVVRSLFPCGSITGAPKVRATQIIREIEAGPRGVYTGAIGFVRPGGDCVFNVAIRTIVLDRETGIARFGAGGGITADSTVEGEYDECLLKASFLDLHRPDFGLLETMLIEDGEWFLLERHLARAAASARFFGFTWDEGAVRKHLFRTRTQHCAGRWRVRCLFDRGGGVRIEALQLPDEGKRVLRVGFAAQPVDSRDVFLYHKTTHREVYELALRSRPDCDDVLLWNERGEVTESALANLVIEDENGMWTPGRDAGLLSGTFRDELIAGGQLRERVIMRREMDRKPSFRLVNSVRRWMTAALVD